MDINKDYNIDSVLNTVESFFTKDKESFLSSYKVLPDVDKFYTLLSCLNVCEDNLMVEKKEYFSELKSDLSFVRYWNRNRDGYTEEFSIMNNISMKIMNLIPIEYGKI